MNDDFNGGGKVTEIHGGGKMEEEKTMNDDEISEGENTNSDSLSEMPGNGEFEEEETTSKGGISKEEKANPDILAHEDITQDKDEENMRESLDECEEISEENGNTRESKELEDQCTEKLDSSELVEDQEESQLEDGETD